MSASDEEDVRGGISAEDQEFWMSGQYGTVEPPPEADTERMLSIVMKLKPLLEKIPENTELGLLLKGVPFPGMPPTPGQLRQLVEYEKNLRKVIERLEFLLQMGVGDAFQDTLDSTCFYLAAAILAQKGNREEEAQMIYLVLLSKSVAKFGPYHLGTAEIMFNLASSIPMQGRTDLQACVLLMAYTLLKNGEDKEKGWTDGMTVLERLRVELINTFQEYHRFKISSCCQETVEPLLREHIALLDARTKDARTICPYAERLGRNLLQQGKFLEAEEFLERNLSYTMELAGIKTVDQRLQELQGESVKTLEQKMRRAGLAIPAPGTTKDKLMRMYAEHTYNKDEHPEKLPRAEALHRLALVAKLNYPGYGPEFGGTLWTMNDLRDSLAGQHKYVEAFSVGARSPSIRQGMSNPRKSDLKDCLEREKEITRQQAAFRKEAAKVMGPRDTWIGDDDGEPAKIMFEKTVQEANQGRASSSANKSHKAAPKYEPIAYDPADKTAINYAAIMAGLGVTGIRVAKMKVKREPVSCCLYNTLIPQDTMPMDKGASCWACVVALMHSSLSLPTASTNPPSLDSAQGVMSFALEGALRMNASVMDLLNQAKGLMQQVAEASKEVVTEMQEEEAAAASQEGRKEDPPFRHSKPKRICSACGAYGARKRCSRCNQAYFCSYECSVRAWRSFHKSSCVPKEK